MQHYRSIGFLHPDDFAAVIDAWADFTYTDTASGSRPREMNAPNDAEAFLRMVAAHLSRTPGGAER